MTTRDFDIARSVMVGETADNELVRAQTILRNEGINPEVVMEFTVGADGIFCGIAEARSLLSTILPETGREVWALEEGADVTKGEVALRIKAPYASFGLYETAVCGILASSTGWATAGGSSTWWSKASAWRSPTAPNSPRSSPAETARSC